MLLADHLAGRVDVLGIGDGRGGLAASDLQLLAERVAPSITLAAVQSGSFSAMPRNICDVPAMT